MWLVAAGNWPKNWSKSPGEGNIMLKQVLSSGIRELKEGQRAGGTQSYAGELPKPV